MLRLMCQAAVHRFEAIVFIQSILVYIIGADAVHCCKRASQPLIMTMYDDSSAVQLAELSGRVVYP